MSFAEPVTMITASTVEEVLPALEAIQTGLDSGYFAAGYFAYEAAPAFDPAFTVQNSASLPLLWFGLFREPQEVFDIGAGGAFSVSGWKPATSESAYGRNIGAIRDAIARGETYQVNYTLRFRAIFEGDDFAFYRRIADAQQADYCAYLNLGRLRILSASPELFFSWARDRVITRPMKGTVPRGLWSKDDRERAAWLAHSEKNRAENLMTVDLIRNDLGRIAEYGSVAVPDLFTVEAYPTVYQMTSTVTADLPSGAGWREILAALFPSGSVTGAPKISTMRLIAALEESPRGAYCGSIGYITPQREAVFNVAIRTVVVDREIGIAEYGVGGGVTWDSTAEDEYAEMVSKARILTEERPSFDLLETMLLEDGSFALLDRHLNRLVSSAAYFGLRLPMEGVKEALEAHADLHCEGTWRIRLLVSQEGTYRIEHHSLNPLPPARTVDFARAPIDRDDRFLYHKTTHRAVYEAHSTYKGDLFDILLYNDRDEVTEFTTANMVVEIGGTRFTPPVECGLLAGTMREELLSRGEISERILTRKEVQSAERLWWINSVRGWVSVELR